MRKMDDLKIIDLFFARDEQAIQETDKTYGKKLFALADRILNDREDSEESVSDTYWQAWETIPPNRPGHFYGFLASICRHLSLNRLDWKLAAKRNAEVVALTLEMEQCIPGNLQDENLEGEEIRRVLESFLETLPSESRLIFLRRYLYMDTIAEIARRYGIGESKVKTQLHRTRRKLRTHLEKEGVAL